MYFCNSDKMSHVVSLTRIGWTVKTRRCRTSAFRHANAGEKSAQEKQVRRPPSATSLEPSLIWHATRRMDLRADLDSAPDDRRPVAADFARARAIVLSACRTETKGVHMRIKSFIAASGVLTILAAFLAAPALAQPKSGPVAPVCANCHEAQWKAIDLTPHGAKSSAEGRLCQACHGNAAEHLKDPMKAKPSNPFAKGHTADERTAVCLGCHS